jgi:hypothetical protein
MNESMYFREVHSGQDMDVGPHGHRGLHEIRCISREFTDSEIFRKAAIERPRPLTKRYSIVVVAHHGDTRLLVLLSGDALRATATSLSAWRWHRMPGNQVHEVIREPRTASIA